MRDLVGIPWKNFMAGECPKFLPMAKNDDGGGWEQSGSNFRTNIKTAGSRWTETKVQSLVVEATAAGTL